MTDPQHFPLKIEKTPGRGAGCLSTCTWGSSSLSQASAGAQSPGVGALGLSMYHISPRDDSKDGLCVPRPRMKFRRGASLMSCELGKTVGQRGKRHDWTRGKITNFSKQSRRRILRLVASLKRQINPIFCTLTYPDIYPEDPREWKKHLDTFFKRLLRKYPKALVIWRLERIERKSGENQGQIAPHFHLLAYGVPYEALRTWVPQAWYQVVGSQDPKHLVAGTRVEQVHSVRGVLNYTAKYISKAENLELEGIGRIWGIVGRDQLSEVQGVLEVVEIDPETALRVLRYMRHKASEVYSRQGKFKGRRKIPRHGIKFTLIGDSEFWYVALPKIQAMQESNNATTSKASG
jgi:hypothetical protein